MYQLYIIQAWLFNKALIDVHIICMAQKKVSGMDIGDMATVVKFVAEKYAVTTHSAAQIPTPAHTHAHTFAMKSLHNPHRHSGVNKKYIARVCDGIQELLQKK